jgi:hypothetical protein
VDWGDGATTPFSGISPLTLSLPHAYGQGRLFLAAVTVSNYRVPQPDMARATVAIELGSAKLARGEVVSKMWEYIKKNNLQDPANKRDILADAKLKPIFDGKDKVSMFEMNKHLAKHLK